LTAQHETVNYNTESYTDTTIIPFHHQLHHLPVYYTSPNYRTIYLDHNNNKNTSMLVAGNNLH